MLARTAPIIQQGDLPIISNAKCRQNADPERDYSLVSDNMICAGYQEGGVDACAVSKRFFTRLFVFNFLAALTPKHHAPRRRETPDNFFRT